VHSSRRASRGDSAQLFLENKNLIAKMAVGQQDVWELEERVAFARNSRDLLARDIIKKMFAKAEGQKAKQMTDVAFKVVLELAEIDRRRRRSGNGNGSG
jgi:hypothetical protein